VLLAIDTATRWAGIALYDDQGLHVEHVWRTRANHTVELMPFIDSACEQQGLTPQDLSAVAISLGPGSFTGLRVGLSLGKGLAMALDIPILGVPTLDAVAYAQRRELLPVCTVLPAGRGRWCVGFYETETGDWQRRGDYRLLSSADLLTELQDPILVCGETSPTLVAELDKAASRGVVVAAPAASARRPGYLAELAWARFAAGESDDLQSLAPIYLQHS
jgi:tRNA threonylcarbamoyladenosine biosynthesis protein TsaB